MARCVISPTALRDIEAALQWSETNLGSEATDRYAALIDCSIKDIADTPKRSGSRVCEDVSSDLRIYHLWHSRRRVPLQPGRVKKPRHFLLYRVISTQTVELVRVLHDNMDVERHVREVDTRSSAADTSSGE